MVRTAVMVETVVLQIILLIVALMAATVLMNELIPQVVVLAPVPEEDQEEEYISNLKIRLPLVVFYLRMVVVVAYQAKKVLELQSIMMVV
jgi:hypothetical protein